MIIEERRELVNYFLDKNFLLSPDFLNNLPKNFNKSEFLDLVFTKINSEKKPLLLNKDLFSIVYKSKTFLDINWDEFEKARALLEKGKNGKIYETFLDLLGYTVFEKKKKKLDKVLEDIKKPIENGLVGYGADTSVVVLKSYEADAKKRNIQDFVLYFRNRYEALKQILENRQELQNLISINKIIGKRDREQVSLIGLVSNKAITKNGNMILTLEDPTGQINVLITKNKSLFEIAKDVVFDEVIGISGVGAGNIVFGNEVVFPDIPVIEEMKKAPDEVYAAFISDLHVGSKMFLLEDFSRFLKWIKGESGNFIQKRIAEKVKYLFIIGDLVDGIGIYPEQDKELLIKNVQKQYEECARLLDKIPKHIKIIICPGNHDALRIAEPQPVLNKKFTEPLWNLGNVIMVSNPAWVNIHSSENFNGFDVLMYHGYSFDYYANSIDNIRLNGGYDRADLMMKFLLKKRHLAPTHTSTLYIPDTEKDPLVIDRVPDFFVTGHIHKVSIGNYRNITLVCGSCWQSRTTFQEKVGHHPEPSRVPVVNLKTREIKIMKF